MVFYFFICVLGRFKSVLLILLVLFILFKPSIFVLVMLATLSTCTQLERDNITYRLQSGSKQYIIYVTSWDASLVQRNLPTQRRKNTRMTFPF